jgi:hypothetical protein
MKVTLINHSSILFKLSNSVFLTDFWNNSPAFGSWLPSAMPFYHPTYLASLSYQKNFFLVLSHAHDDHIDDYFLKKYFCKDMRIIINKFPSPSLQKRIKKMGFENIVSISDNITVLKGFELLSIFDENVSNDDAGIAFRNKKYCIFHGNDNWFKLSKNNENKLRSFAHNRKFVYCSQTNSASGHPLIYPQFDYKQKQKNLKKKIILMIKSGLENTKKVKANFFLPYAGFSKPYVKNEKYNEQAFDPIYENLYDLIKNEKKINNKKKMVNIFCGGTLDLTTGNVKYPFDFNPKNLISLTDKFIKNEKLINKCDTFKRNTKDIKVANEKEVKEYLLEFYNFVSNYLKRFPKFYPEIKNKNICFEIVSDKKIQPIKVIICMKNGKFKSKARINKKFVISSNLFNELFNKKIVFENLYTGYQSKVFRYPVNKYNRDIIIFLDMFGYKYKNS